MKNYIIVIHQYFVSSKGFITKEIKAKNDDDAYDQAVLLSHEHERSTNHCSFKIIQLEDSKRVASKLSWEERITGNLKER